MKKTLQTLVLCSISIFSTCFITFGQGPDYSLTFDGNDGVNIGSIGDLGTTYSVEFWVKPGNLTQSAFIVAYLTSSLTTTNNVAIEASQSGTNLRLHIRDNAGNVGFISASNVLASTTEWYHYAGVRNGNNLTLYVNGEVVGTNSASLGPLTMDQLSFGTGWHDQSNQWVSFFNGEIEDVRIWNDVRTQTEIRDNMCKKLNGSETGLVGYWNMDENASDTCIPAGNADICDLSGNANHGTNF